MSALGTKLILYKQSIINVRESATVVINILRSNPKYIGRLRSQINILDFKSKIIFSELKIALTHINLKSIKTNNYKKSFMIFLWNFLFDFYYLNCFS